MIKRWEFSTLVILPSWSVSKEVGRYYPVLENIRSINMCLKLGIFYSRPRWL